MTVTTFQGRVEKGQIKLPKNILLPEKAIVYVVLPDSSDLPETKTRKNKFNLAELVAQIPPDYEVSEENWGSFR